MNSWDIYLYSQKKCINKIHIFSSTFWLNFYTVQLFVLFFFIIIILSQQNCSWTFHKKPQDSSITPSRGKKILHHGDKKRPTEDQLIGDDCTVEPDAMEG